VTPRDRSPFTAGKMGASRTKAREIPHARHDFPHYRRGIQLLMANPSSCAGLKRNSAENPVPYRTIPHGWAFRPRLIQPISSRIMALQYRSGHGSSRTITSPLETGAPMCIARIVSMISIRRFSGVMPAALRGTRPSSLPFLPLQASRSLSVMLAGIKAKNRAHGLRHSTAGSTTVCVKSEETGPKRRNKLARYGRPLRSQAKRP